MVSLRRAIAAAAVATILIVLACSTNVAAADNNSSGSNNSSSNNSSVGNRSENYTNVTNAPQSPVTPAPPVSMEPMAYRVRLWAYAASYVVANYRAAFASALSADIATALSVTSSLTLNDVVLVSGTSENITVVFTVRGTSSDARTVLATANGASAAWATATNALLTTVWNSMSERRALAANDASYYKSLYVTSIERLASADLPKIRYFEVVIEGKHLGAASERAGWSAAVKTDLATAFGVTGYKETHLNVSSQTVSGTNRTVVTVRFFVKPVVGVAVDSMTFFATRGAADWLTHVESVHKDAAYAAFNISTPAPMVVGRDAAVMADSLPESEYSVTVTSTSYAPGDESYGSAGGVARGILAVAASALIVVLSLVAF